MSRRDANENGGGGGGGDGGGDGRGRSRGYDSTRGGGGGGGRSRGGDDRGDGDGDPDDLPFLYPSQKDAITINPNVLSQARGWPQKDVVQYLTTHGVILICGLAGCVFGGTYDAAYAGMGAAALLITSVMSYSLFTKT